VISDKPIHEIMVPLAEYPCITATHTLRQAIDEMVKSHIRRRDSATLARVALIFDAQFHRLLGMLRRRDIMRGLAPRFLLSGSMHYDRKLFDVDIDPNLAELTSEKVIARIRERADCAVREFMVPITATIDYNDHLMKAVYEMVDQNTSLLPVLKDGIVVGVVRSVDLLDELALMIRV
jgi:CBS domain-containing protein